MIGVVKGVEASSLFYIQNRHSQGGGALSISYIHNWRSQGRGGASYIQNRSSQEFGFHPYHIFRCSQGGGGLHPYHIFIIGVVRGGGFIHII